MAMSEDCVFTEGTRLLAEFRGKRRSHRYSRRDSCLQYHLAWLSSIEVKIWKREFTESDEENEAGDGASWIGTAFIMANIIIGAGLLNFPAAYRDAGGIMTAIICQMICIGLVILGLFFIAHCSDLCNKDTFQDVVAYYCGIPGLVLCNIFIVIHNWGTCITMLVILGDQVDQVLLYIVGPEFCSYWYLRRNFTLSVLTIFLIMPLCFPERMDAFKFVSAIGVATTGYLLFLVVWKYAITDTSDVQIKTRPSHFMDVFKVIPTICFSFEGHVEAVPLYSGFKMRTLKEFGKSILFGYLMCVIVYTIVGCFGYLTFGREIKSDLLTSYTLDVSLLVGVVIMAIKSITCYPVVIFCARLVIDDLLETQFGCGYPNCTDTRRRCLIIVVLVVLSLLLALLVPSIGSIISLLGGSATLFVFIFPGLCFMQAFLQKNMDYCNWYVSCGVAMVVFGVFLGATTTVQSILRFTNEEFQVKESPCAYAAF